MSLSIQAILVPQGAEYRAVYQGLNHSVISMSPVLPIPVGPKPLTSYLEKLQSTGKLCHEHSRVLLMGLCGSLTPSQSIGDIVLYQSCVYRTNQSTLLSRSCDSELTDGIARRLEMVSSVKALTSDRLIWSATEKHQLGQEYGTDVVDMEGFAALEVLGQARVAVAMVRVVSDDCDHDLPDLTEALSPEGSLRPGPLVMGMLRQPLAATRLIQGSLRGLQVLRELTTHLFADME